MSTGASRWRETGNCARAAFRTAIARTHDGQGVSPMAAEADAIYSAIAPYGLTRLAAAMSWVEVKNNTWPDSVYWGLQHAYRNPWAMKTDGRWIEYPDYEAAARDWAQRLTDPSGPYAATQTIAQLIAVYAPQSDGNDERAYVDAVCVGIDALPLSGEGQRVTEPGYREWAVAGTTKLLRLPADITFSQRIVSDKQLNQRPGLAMTARWFTQHDTDNKSVGADAEMHARWVHLGCPGVEQPVGFHFVTDDKQIIQLVPIDEVAWHGGDGGNGPGNRTSIGSELCVNRDRNVAATERIGAEFAAGMLRLHGWPVERLRTHWSWVQGTPGAHHCPDSLLGKWASYQQAVGAALSRSGPVVTNPAPQPAPRTFPNLPEWLTDADLMTLSQGLADPTGPITNGYIADCLARGLWPAWSEVEERGGGDKRLWLSGGRIIDYIAATRRIVVRGAS